MSSDPLSWLDTELESLEARHLRRRLIDRAGPQTSSIQVDSKPLINFSANDYLGLAADPRLAEAAAKAARDEGWGAGASPLVTGRSTAHAELGAPTRRIRRGRGGARVLVRLRRQCRRNSRAGRARRRDLRRRQKSRQPDRRLPPVARRSAYLSPLRRRSSRRAAARFFELSPPIDRHRFDLQHGRRSRAACEIWPNWPSDIPQC